MADAAHINRNASLEVPYDISDDKIQAEHVFDALVALGLPQDQVDAFRGVTDEDGFIDALYSVDTGIQSFALSLYETAGMTIPRSKYTVFDGSNEFEEALRGDMEQWELYLHPSQRYLYQCQDGMCISGNLTMTERTPRHLISSSGPNWVGTDSAV